MKKKFLISVILITSILVYLFSTTSSNNMKSINDFLKHQVENNETPSIQYAFFNLDSTIYQAAYGLRDIKTTKHVDTSTTYNLFSITKTFTALSVLQLAQAGKIELNKPVADYLPQFPYSKQITVLQILSHTAGIPNPIPLRWIHLTSEQDAFKRDIFFEEIFKNNPKLKSEPGTQFRYSNLGYVLLGQLIEKVSGQSYEDYVQQNIVTAISVTPASLGFHIDSSVHATGYHKYWSFSNALFGLLIDKKKFMTEKEGRWKPFRNFYTNGTAYGGMVGSASSLINYAQALLKQNSPLLSDEYKKILFTETVIHTKPTGMSLSWFTGILKGNKYYAHAGGGGGYYVELRIYPDLGVGSVIMFNRSGMKDERILDKADSFFITEKATVIS